MNGGEVRNGFPMHLFYLREEIVDKASCIRDRDDSLYLCTSTLCYSSCDTDETAFTAVSL